MSWYTRYTPQLLLLIICVVIIINIEYNAKYVYLIVWSSSARVCLACLLPLFFCFRCWLFQVLHSYFHNIQLSIDICLVFWDLLPLLRLPCCELISVALIGSLCAVLFSQIGATVQPHAKSYKILDDEVLFYNKLFSMNNNHKLTNCI